MSKYFGADSLIRPNDNIGNIVEETFDPRNGPVVTFEWKGREDYIRLEAAYQLNTLKRKISIRKGGDGLEWTLQAFVGANETTSPTEPLSDRWTMHWNMVQKSIWQNPRVLGEWHKIYGVGGVDRAHTLAQLKSDLIALSRGETVTASGATAGVGDDVTITFDILLTIGVSIGLDRTVLILLILDLMDGVDVYEVAQCVIRRTRVVPSDTQIRVDPANIGRMISSLSSEGLPASQVFSHPLPSGGFWEKKRPEIDQTASDKYTIVEEYWHADDYSLLNFGDPV
jgi:hypothetical protein